jgi:predicted permease
MMVDPEMRLPVRVRILSLLALAVAAINGLRLGEAIFLWKTLKEYGASPLYISVSGGIWLILGLILVWGFWLGISWAGMATVYGTAGYTAWYWFDRSILQGPHANWPFVLLINIIILVMIFGILFSLRMTRFFKRDVHERQSETSTLA